MQWSMHDVVRETLGASTEAELIATRARVLRNPPAGFAVQRIDHLIPQRDKNELALSYLGRVPSTWPTLVSVVRWRNRRRTQQAEEVPSW